MVDFNAVFNDASIGIIISDEDGKIRRANPYFLHLLEYELTELTAYNIETLIRPQVLGDTIEMYALTKSGKRIPVDIYYNHYHENGRNILTVVVYNLTHRQKREQQLLELNAVLETKLAVLEETANAREKLLKTRLKKEIHLNNLKTKFVSLAAHEFRVPLGSILSSSYLILQYGQKGDYRQLEKHVDKIKRAVGLLTGILNNFLSIEKIEEKKINASVVHFQIEEFLKNITEELAPFTAPHQEIIFTHTGPSDVSTDPILLRHIVTNLLSNAIKFSTHHQNVYLFSNCTADKIEISVVDQGIGIPRDAQNKIFDRYYRASNSSGIQGTGLGMSIIYNYIKLLKGTINFHSEEGKGTTFIVTLNK